ncbi:MAG: Mu transposase domain-containing protein [Gemmatimonadota bacterium]
MLSWEDDVEAHALRQRGWSISAIARHLGHDRKTVRAYLRGEREPGRRASRGPDVMAPFVEYCRIRLADDPHLWASALLDELRELGYRGSYPSLTAAIRSQGLRPHCEPCQASAGRDAAIIAHPPGEETQFDWLELPGPPPGWGCGTHAHLLVGALSSSGRWRGVLAEAEDFAHLAGALDQVVRRLGGLTRRWRFDRMATVCHPATGTLTAEFAGLAKYYQVGVDVCPPRHGNRKGVVEKANHSAAQRWWRTLPDDTAWPAAQQGVDTLAARMDGRRRVRGGQRVSVGELATSELLRPVPDVPYPAELAVTRTVTAQALVAFRGNSYSVPPGLAGATVTLTHRLGSGHLAIATASGSVIARHRRACDGSGAVVRDGGHVTALEKAVLASFSAAPPCRRKDRRPPSAAALAEAARLRGTPGPAERVVIDLAAYAAAATTLQHYPRNQAQDKEKASDPAPDE